MAKEIIDSVEKLEEELARVREAQRKFSTYTQEQVDKIFLAAAKAANMARIPLAKMAVEETGMGVVEDKIIKNHYAAEYIYNKYKNTKTCGVIDEDKAYGTKRIAEPLGVICAVIPTTNPTSTAIFKTLISLKTRNGIIISPHPRAKKSTAAAAKIVLDAAVAAGAPENIISWIDAPSLDMTNLLMKEADIILATGGIGGLFLNSTNYPHITGDSFALAIKHGVELKDINYIQIHPTTLYSKKKGRRFLISESVRGEGAILLNEDGERFTDCLLYTSPSPRD